MNDSILPKANEWLHKNRKKKNETLVNKSIY